MKELHVGNGLGWIPVAAGLAAAGSVAATTAAARPAIPYLATRHDTVRDMLWMADVGKDDVVYDLGSGDGRIVLAAVRDFGARRAVGIENDPDRVRQGRDAAQEAGLAGRVEFILGDLFATDFSRASVVTLFLGHQPNIELRPRLCGTLKPGARVLSHQYGMGEWEPDKTLSVRSVYLGMWGEMVNPFQDNPRVPDYSANEMHFGTSDKVMLWVVPAPVAGVWRGTIATPDGPRDYRLTLHQRLAGVTGTFELSGSPPLTGAIHGEVWGDDVRHWNGSHGPSSLRFDGHASGDSIRGTLAMLENDRQCEHPWEGRRDKADLTGQWEWTCPTGDRPVRLRVERRAGRLAATYLDRDRLLPVPDFYDLGGGFYFTLLVGRDEHGVTITEDTGWLIAEGVVDHGELRGTLDFYPYPAGAPPSRPDAAGKPPTEVHQDWAPRPVGP